MAAGVSPFRLFISLAFAVLLFLPPAEAAQEEKSMLKDMAGRTVTIPKKVDRIVPLGGALRFVVYMQALDRVVGIEALEQKRPIPAGRLYSLAVAEKADGIPAIGEGGPGRLPDFERIIAVRPDLILAMGVDTAQVETIQQKTGVPVFALSYGSIGVLETKDVRESLRILGNILGKKQRADELISFMEGLERDLEKRSAGVKQRPSAYVGAISFKGLHGITSTEAFYGPLLWIKGRNAADEIGRPGHFFIDPEKLLFWNPDTIFLDAGGLGMVSEDYRKNKGFYQRLKAVREGKTFVVLPYNYYHTNIEIALADAYFMGKTLYPPRFSDIDPVKKADEIFRFFTGIAAYSSLKKEFYGFGTAVFGDKGVTVR